MIKNFEQYTQDIEGRFNGLQNIEEFKKLDSKEGKSIVKKLIDIVKDSVKLKKKEEEYLDKHINNKYLENGEDGEDYLDKHFINKYLEDGKDKKLSNAWTLVITKEYMSTNIGVRYPLYYYIVDEKDSIEGNKYLAWELYDELRHKNDNVGVYQLRVRNPEYDPSLSTSDESNSKVWQVLCYEYELDCNYCPDSVRYLIKKAKDCQYTKDHNIEVKPKKVDSLEELAKVMEKVKTRYNDLSRETEEFLCTPLDKVEEFVFKIKPSECDMD